MKTGRTTSRRRFLKAASLTSFGVLSGVGARIASGFPANEKLGIGFVGVAGRGGGNFKSVEALHQNIVALCDVDSRKLGETAKRVPAAKKYTDYRKLVEQSDVEAVVVSTPDHNHALVSLAAMRAGKHVYCEKPLAHTVEEVDVMQRTARELGRVTQMGTQIHAHANYRRVVELIQTGAIGTVHEAHCWVGKHWGGGTRPTEAPPVPEYLDYELWLGPAPYRPYHPVYLPANWRRWWDFGGGTLGDMGCHLMDLPFWALSLGEPTSVEAAGPEVNPETAPVTVDVTWDFPRRGAQPACQLCWHDGGSRPKLEGAEEAVAKFGSGVLFVGAKGMLIADYGRHLLLPEKQYEGFQPPAPFISDSVGHHNEWVLGCKGEGTPLCEFSYSGLLSKTVLLGNVAYRLGTKLDWDAAAGRVTNHPDAAALIAKEYRKGWSLGA